jgi:hypothetical protein
MDNLAGELLKILKTDVGQGNSNTSKLTEKIIELNPELDYNRTKIEIVNALRELNDNGQINIMTENWELGDEFLYLDAGAKSQIEIVDN